MTERHATNFGRITRTVWAKSAAMGFRGSDPYDGLNSRLLAPILQRSRLARLVVIQGVKRSPLNLRPILGIPPGLNPKGLALMLQGAAEWPELDDSHRELAWLADAQLCLASTVQGTPALADRIIREGTADRIGAGEQALPPALGWGYDFPWQSKAFLQPAYFPTVVATSFVTDALEWAENPAFGPAVVAAAHFVADHLHQHRDQDGICFSYSPGDRTRVYNASLFGARILAQAAPHDPANAARWNGLARHAVEWVMARQREDGSWIYGEADHWQWIDNLHTGFNLETIYRVARLLQTEDWDEGLARGLRFYRDRLFDPDGTPRYYTTRPWPLDPHSFAQGALTFIRLRDLDPDGKTFAERILTRGIEELWDEHRGGFRFQKHPHYSQGIIHMRWSQAWMFRALCAFLAQD